MHFAQSRSVMLLPDNLCILWSRSLCYYMHIYNLKNTSHLYLVLYLVLAHFKFIFAFRKIFALGIIGLNNFFFKT